MVKIVAVTVVLALLVGVGFYIWFSRSQTVSPEQPSDITLQIWSMEDQEATLKPAMDAYTREHPNVVFAYKYQPMVNYTSRALTQIEAGSGPDILMIHNSWLPIFYPKKLLAPMPGGIEVAKEYSSQFFPVLTSSFGKEGQIYGISSGVDGLVMFYNITMLREANIRPPLDWREFGESSLKLTKRDGAGKITQAGAAVGLRENVTYWPQILGLLFLQQPGANLADPAVGNGPEVMRFYTGFAIDPTKQVWSSDFGNDLDAFASGRVAIIFGQIDTINKIREKNPNLRFSTAAVPQLAGKTGGDISWASFWGWGVNSRSPYTDVAWDFLRFVASAGMEKELFLSTLQSTKQVGQVYSRVDLAAELINDSKLGAFLRQGPSYNFWYLETGVEDKDLNEKIVELYRKALDGVIAGEDPLRALSPIQSGVAEVFSNLGWQL